jgi:Spy/CpxP family protein refolding chaperone
MKKTTLTIGAILVLALLIAAPIAFAQFGRMHRQSAGDFGGVMMLGRLQRAKQTLGLSDQQVSDIQTIFKTLRDQNAPYRDSMRSGMQSVMQTLINNPNDLAAAQALLDQQAAAEKAMKTNVLTAASKALNVLTPDQRTRLSAVVQERMERRIR